MSSAAVLAILRTTTIRAWYLQVLLGFAIVGILLAFGGILGLGAPVRVGKRHLVAWKRKQGQERWRTMGFPVLVSREDQRAALVIELTPPMSVAHQYWHGTPPVHPFDAVNVSCSVKLAGRRYECAEPVIVLRGGVQTFVPDELCYPNTLVPLPGRYKVTWKVDKKSRSHVYNVGAHGEQVVPLARRAWGKVRQIYVHLWERDR